jgi:hypothetical protein
MTYNQKVTSNVSAENIDLINCIYKAFHNKDTATLLSLLSHNINIIQCPQVPWGGAFQGIDEAQLFFETVNKYLDSHVAIELIINGGDRIAVIGRAHGTIKGTGGPFDVPIMHLWTFKDGLAGRLEIVLDVPVMQAALRRQQGA